MHVAILIFPNVQLLDVVGPMDVFSEASKQSGNSAAYRISLVGLRSGAVTASNGVQIVPDLTISDDMSDIDTLLVPGQQDRSALDEREMPLGWLVKQSRHIRRLGSICSGASILAAAGLLDGKRATTHWQLYRQLASRHPLIQVIPDKTCIKDGQIYTSAGVTAGMDLALQMVEEDLGKSVTMRVARELIIFPQRLGGQLQFSETSCGMLSPVNRSMQQLQQWVQQNLDKPLTVEHLALQAGMSLRNFVAAFEDYSKTSPTEFIEATRTIEASKLLRETDLAVSKIASLCGFRDCRELRFAFRRRYGASPVGYRRSFQAATATA